MAFSSKTDYCGLGESNVLAVRSATENKSGSTYAPDGENGATIAVEAYGLNATPSNDYALQGTLTKSAGAWQLGKVITFGTSPNQTKYRLTSIKITTAANAPVGISATAQLVEATATDVVTNNLAVPALTVTTAHLAQDVFSAFSISGTNANLTACDASIDASASTDTLVGNIISNGIGSGIIKVSGTILVSGDDVPTLTLESGWVQTAPLTCSNPETAYKSYTFEIQKPLARATAGGTST